MELSFVYVPVTDLPEAAHFYRDVLGLDVAWNEGDTVAFTVPGGSTQLMVSSDPKPAGPMLLVDDVAQWLAEHAEVPVEVEAFTVPGGTVVGLADPAGNVFYVVDQATDPA